MAVTPKFRLSLPVYNEVGWDDDVNDNFSLIDGLLGQYVALSDVVGVWETSTLYAVGNKVIDSVDSSFWTCAIAHTSPASGVMSASRTANPTYWTSATASYIEAAASAAAAEASADRAEAAAAVIDSLGAYRNAVINGNFVVWQRGDIIVPVVGATYLADRWRTFFNGAGGTTTVTHVTRYTTSALLNDAGLSDYLDYNVTVNPAGQTSRQLATDIEGVETFAGRTCTVSYYACVGAGSQIPNVFVTQNFGTGGGPSANVDQSIAFPQWTTTWQRFQHTFTLASIAGKTIGTNNDDKLIITFFLPAATLARFIITGVQVEIGSTATPFAYRPVQQELAMCQRYHQVIDYIHYGYQTIGNFARIAVNHPVQMRATPTAAIVGAAADVNITAPSTILNTAQSSYGGTATATGPYAVVAQYRLSAELS